MPVTGIQSPAGLDSVQGFLTSIGVRLLPAGEVVILVLAHGGDVDHQPPARNREVHHHAVAAIVAVFPTFGFFRGFDRRRGRAMRSATPSVPVTRAGMTARTAKLVVTIARLRNDGRRYALKSQLLGLTSLRCRNRLSGYVLETVHKAVARMDLKKSIWSSPITLTIGRKCAPRRVFLTGVAFALVVGLSAPADAARKSRQGSTEAKKTEPRNDFVSIGGQRVTLYDNGARVAQGAVATGMPGRATPIGVFSVIQKDRNHRSNIYSNAPMPYMQRITWSGVALHEGPLPGYPASHGCIRLSHDFASRLWLVAKLGARVIVARNEVAPVDFTHPHLFAPKPKPVEPQVARSEAERPAEIVKSIQVAAATTSKSATSPEMVVPTKRTGHVAVFVSRKEKRIFVRQGFVPLFDMPVTIDDPDLPLGTHVFTAMEVTNNGTSMRWNVMTMPGEQPRNAEPKGKKKTNTQAGSAAKPVEAKATTTPEQALDRIHIPQEAIDWIGELLIPGSSLVVSDQGLGPETGRGTDFIVITP
jgi:hypothetical protein